MCSSDLAVALLGDAAHPSWRGARLLAVVPGTDAGVRGLTTDRARVERATRIGYRSVTTALARAVP